MLSPVERLAGVLADPARRDRAMAVLLAGYALVWSLYGTFAKASQDVHVDMGEMIAWSREASLGTPKHPPLGAWVAGLWFSVIPQTDWTFYLLAMLMPALALWSFWRLSADYLDAEKRVAGVALLTLLPFMNFHALKYNANTVLIPLWAATTFWFLRSFETGRILWAALAGLGAAAAMLGKYWSICLVAGLGIAALVDSRRAAYFRSAAPWVSIATGAALFAPHIVWLFAHQFGSISYAGKAHQMESRVLVSALFFIGSFVSYIAPAIVGALFIARPNTQALHDMLLPSSPQRRLVNIAFLAPLVLAIVAGILLSADITALWMMPAVTLLPIVLLSSALLALRRKAAVGLLAFALAFPLIMLVAAPGIAMVIHRHGVPRHSDHYRMLAQALEKSWLAQTGRPLAIVGSDDNLANGMLFYFSSRPVAYYITAPALSPWLDDARIAREGIALACPADERTCVDALTFRSTRAGISTTEITLVRQYLGVPGAPARYVIPPKPGNSD
jgi:4-amino-4-deoxy-L-arabinose transferase-like glycosyltransferase